jgi:hypothetical protein
MIFYNWRKIYKYSEGKVSTILDILYYITNHTVPNNKWDKRFFDISKVDWSGKSFLLHPEELFLNRSKYSGIELSQYVALASLRNYADYKATNIRHLISMRTPEINFEKIRQNRLLSIDSDENIHFLWEEVNTGENKNGTSI